MRTVIILFLSISLCYSQYLSVETKNEIIQSIEASNITGDWYIVKQREDASYYNYIFNHKLFIISFYSDSTYRSNLPKICGLNDKGTWEIENNLLVFNKTEHRKKIMQILKLDKKELTFCLEKTYGDITFFLSKKD